MTASATDIPGIGSAGFARLVGAIGIRLEITAPLDPQWNRHTEQGRIDLALWCDTKAKGQDVTGALVELIRETRKRYGGH